MSADLIGYQAINRPQHFNHDNRMCRALDGLGRARPCPPRCGVARAKRQQLGRRLRCYGLAERRASKGWRWRYDGEVVPAHDHVFRLSIRSHNFNRRPAPREQTPDGGPSTSLSKKRTTTAITEVLSHFPLGHRGL
jgi:hypothetical protein